ncbi:nitroreductase/quinone reductase family protein [Nocardioides bruguierae]|uniref:Nitroreductase family deazaflavin-dependent oxidoreductase n=1 Tax=Nocardioides bruguierae TaxID=2945102 RepID=A0A9X2D8Q5_9ACTN|nr:nitroreductase/quinone reductase family protein [Nocardioides bruguierae]MCL8026862.1 nitroreductase family deazaflavin-dependent oxidoreductase [Nocardioides bruguierae]MCM0621401.1 nitroreductase family deazaflavin-dependent oxidoreductase [Nocardioides bruguierae]
MSDFNARVLAEFHERHGVVTEAAPFGDSLVVLHTVGARSGAPRVSPVMGIEDGDGWLVAASKAGAPDNPAWYHNLLAHPDLVIETGDGTTITRTDVHATDLEGAERDAAWERFKQASPGFAEYEARTARTIPVLRLSPR